MTVKRTVSFIAGLLFVTALVVRADSPVFGNALGNGNPFSLAFASGNTWGGAVLFTPAKDISLSSVTLWLSGYNGMNGISPSVGIYDSYELPGNLFELGSEVVSLNTPTANNGIESAFTFSNSSTATLKAHQDYWLFAYGMWNGTGSSFGGAASYWDAGGTPTGNAVFDQADYFNNGYLSPTAAIPAFSINSNSPNVPVVPEPSTVALLAISFLFGLGRTLYNRATEKKLAPVKVRRPMKRVTRKNFISNV